MKEIDIETLRNNVSEVLEQVRLTKEPVLILRQGLPLAEIVPVSDSTARARMIGSMRGRIEILGDIISPADDEDDWEVLRD
jgi:prevent-host-death family protein